MGRRELEERIEKRREDFVRNSLLSDEFIDFVQENLKPVNTMMAYYQCAIMEVETKFKVLSEQYSLEYDRNPIESIKTRVKSMESLLKKIRRKNIPLTIDAIEENIQDIAGVRVICAFQDDIYKLAKCFLDQDDVNSDSEKRLYCESKAEWLQKSSPDCKNSDFPERREKDDHS